MLAALLAALGAGVAALRLAGQRAWDWCKQHRRHLLIVASLLLAGALMSWWWIWRSSESASPGANATGLTGANATGLGGPRVLVLAFDGLDPRLLEQYLAAGRLPNFQRLAQQGRYHPLPTTMAPQSPVAWCTCITGSDPGEHGIFDFIHRDPASYLPDLSLADRRTLQRPWQGTPFWDRPTLRKLGVVAQRLPMTFPPPRLNGRLLAGMGVWDVRGTEGTYFYYSTTPSARPEARGMLLPLREEGNSGLAARLAERDFSLHGELPGPYRAGEPDTIREPFLLRKSGTGYRLELQGKTHNLAPGRWSDWIEVTFHIGPLGLQKVPAITRVLLQTSDTGVSLYVSPLNFDPRAPLYPITHPQKYAQELVETIGLYATRGMPFDTQAVNDGLLSDADFLEQVRMVNVESEKMLFHELGRFRQGLLFAYFESPDIVQHLFWRGIDPEHPLHNDPETQQHRDAIPRMYEECDALLGRAWEKLGPGGTVVVMSDHGFGPFRRAVHLNAILRDRGLLVLKGGKTTGGELLRDVDWARTKAYALGFNAVYINQAGREKHGCVPPREVEGVAGEVLKVLESWQDRVSGTRPIKKVYRSSELYRKREAARMPDLLVGYRRGYRASWETALGATPAVTIEDNRKKWSGDHCVDASEVPGVLLTSDPALEANALAELGEAIDRYLERRTGTEDKR